MERVSVIQLRDLLRLRGLSNKGNKSELFERLTESLESEGIDLNTLIGAPVMERDVGASGLSVPAVNTVGTSSPANFTSREGGDLHLGDSASQMAGSCTSSRSSVVAERKLLLSARRAAFEAKLKKQMEINNLKRQEFELKQKMDCLQMEAELDQVKAEERILNREEFRSSEEFRTSEEKQEPIIRPPLESGPAVDPVTDGFANVAVSNETKQSKNRVNLGVDTPDQVSDENLVRTLVSCNLKSLMPAQQLKKFGGDNREYFSFIRSFDNIICENLTSDDDRLQYLNQFTEGRPNEIVKACLHLSPGDGYLRARALLEQRYGNTELIASAYVDNILNYKNINRDDVEALDEYSIMLLTCKNAISGIPYGKAELDNPKTMRRIIAKLPFRLQETWRHLADSIFVEKDRSVVFDDVVSFVVKQARVLKNPLFGRHLFLKDDLSVSKNSKANSRVLNASCNATGKSIVCWFCEGSHMVDDCEELKNLNHEDKVNAVYNMGLCYKCLRNGHISSKCRSGIVCKTCGGNHNTLFHFDKRQAFGGNNNCVSNSDVANSGNNTPDQSNYTGSLRASNMRTDVGGAACRDRNIAIYTSSNDHTAGMSVVPVKVRLGGREILTHAFLDPGSSATFCSNDLLKRLSVNPDMYTRHELSVRTMNGQRSMVCRMVPGMTVGDLAGENELKLPTIYSVQDVPVSQCDIISASELEKWSHLSDLHIPEVEAPVEMLIGNNVPRALEPCDVISAPLDDQPFAMRTRLGWMVCGTSADDCRANVNRISVANSKILDELMIEEYNRDFQDLACPKVEMSQDDKNWLTIVENGCKNVGNRYEIPLPLRDSINVLPASKNSALNRLIGLKKKLRRDSDYANKYFKFMTDLINNGHAERADGMPCSSRVWYIPHFGVKHPDKPEKIRVVFDCAARMNGVALNDLLYQGPDLLNSLLGVLMGFRLGKLAYVADIESMFYQVKVPESDRDLLRFLWWPENNLDAEPVEFRMTVHLFGATSSPSIANFALNRTALDNSKHFEESVCKTLSKCFYVDDCLCSLDNSLYLFINALKVKELCRLGGFNLVKYISNDPSFVTKLPSDLMAKGAKDFLNVQSLKVKTLGIEWELKRDRMSVSVGRDIDIPLTKRELLSFVAGIYDPLGILAPCVIEGRLIMQDLCRLQYGWDDKFSDQVRRNLNGWLNKLKEVRGASVPRCIKPFSTVEIAGSQLHFFSDASKDAYGVVVYLRILDQLGNVYVSFVLGKARVSPLKAVSIPRLELTAAALAVKMKCVVLEYIGLDIGSFCYWTDSTTVLRYIENDIVRYQTFVANRVSKIREQSNKSEWRYVDTDNNPADDATRGKQSERWLVGPSFLYGREDDWPREPQGLRCCLENLEVKRDQKVMKTVVGTADSSIFSRLFERYSDWFRLCKAVAYLLLFKNYLRSNGESGNGFKLTLKLIELAEVEIIRLHQSYVFKEEIKDLLRSNCVKKSSNIYKLSPKLVNGLVCVGGRLIRSGLAEHEMYPAILPSEGHLTNLIVNYYHVRVGHMGLMQVLYQLREKYWLIKGTAVVRKVLADCVPCKKAKASVISQQMSALPMVRMQCDKPPFYATGIDCFGPFYTKRGRSQVKRYGVIFTCLTIRAIHLEIAADLSAGSFINTLRRFLARRGQVKILVSDHGANFIGAKNELGCVLASNREKIKDEMLRRKIEWQLTPPGGSHHGGAWERMIGVVRRVLDVTLRNQSVDDDSLYTLFCEVEVIINSRPLTIVSSDCSDIEPISPMSLLGMGGQLFGNGISSDGGGYARRRYRQVQYMADQFWGRWKVEYLRGLQLREKWLCKRRNVSVGDVVLITDETVPRCHWPLGRVTKIHISSDGLVRKVDVRYGAKIYERPISKLVMILENEESPLSI